VRQRLDLADIQGNILRGFGLSFGWHQFVRLDDPAAARAWLAALAGQVPDARLLAAKPSSGLNVGISAAGLTALGVPRPVLARFAPEFVDGMAARAEQLADIGASHPDTWRSAFRPDDEGRPPPLAVVSAYADTDERLRSMIDRLRREADRPGLTPVHSLPVQRFDDGREHFGFADGFAQPAVAGAPRGAKPSLSAAAPGKALPAGEFLLGYRDGEYALTPGPNGPLGRNGTYMVYRELAQDVGAFRAYLRAQAAVSDLSEMAVAAKMVGRWPDGSPLVVSPEAPEAALSAEGKDPRLNDFGYGSDPDGVRCPLGAHIRRVNPRDALGFGDRLSRRHRMIRRGMTYGPRFEQAPDEERGLAFVCFVASIRRQFEFVQAQWCNDGNAFSVGTERDPLVGRTLAGTAARAVGSMTLPGTPTRFLSSLPDVVRTRGGEYFLLPGLAGLWALSASRWS
jgi:Dyp-type peroxidase family